MPRQIEKVISGGQSGVDIGALKAAKAAGIATGGWMPRGWLTERGPCPEYAERFELRQHEKDDYPSRTWRNIESADATLILAGNVQSPGTRLTVEFCERMRKPYAAFDPANVTVQDVLRWLPDVVVLNVAGNRESKSPGIEEWAERFLCDVFTTLKRDW